jgi:hypothetical protein
MKNTISLLILLLLPFIGQSQLYRFCNQYATFYLDSLNIPYLPLNERTGISELPTMSTEKGKKKHKDFFKNTTICQVPDVNGRKIKMSSFLSNYFFADEKDIFVLNFLISYDFSVTGFADIPINTNDFSLVEILEVYDPTIDEYSTIVIRKYKNGFWDYVNEDVEFVSNTDFVVNYE